MELNAYEKKRAALDLLRLHYEEQREQVWRIESRLCMYYDGLVNVSEGEATDADPQDPQPAHAYYELLGAVKFLRLLRTYPFNVAKVQKVISLREGLWAKERGRWTWIKGGIKQPLTTGDAALRWEPFQVFILASIYGFHAWIDTGTLPEDKGELSATERVANGTVEDLRRLCTDFVLCGPRKIDKTGMSAFVAQEHFILEDANSESYCCANSSDQSKLLFRRIKHGLNQLNGDDKWRITETVIDWRMKHQKEGHSSSIRPLSAGGKTKDGMFAQLCCADEYGSAGYTNGKSDMKRLVDVVESSMGPRREPLTVTTTTAGRITTGPFMEKLESLHRLLEREMDWEATGEQPPLSYDRQLCLLLEPDEWEKQNEETLLTSRAVRKKINPMLGKIVQVQFYDDAVAKARLDGDLGEVIAKLFNVYQSASVTQWIKGDAIRPLQIPKRITDCKYEDGWQVFVGLDFGGKDDLWAASYLGVNYSQDAAYEDRYFADCDVWITEAAIKESPNRPLYEKWVQDGWLNVCPGEVFNPDMAVSKIMEKHAAGINLFMFGYDPAQSMQPINTLKAWLQSLGIEGDAIKQMVLPVSQGGMTMNGLVGQLESMILDMRPWIRFSQNPLWPFCFGNCGVYAGRDGTSSLRRVEKILATQKIDPVHALLDALHCFDLSEGQTG